MTLFVFKKPKKTNLHKKKKDAYGKKNVSSPHNRFSSAPPELTQFSNNSNTSKNNEHYKKFATDDNTTIITNVGEKVNPNVPTSGIKNLPGFTFFFVYFFFFLYFWIRFEIKATFHRIHSANVCSFASFCYTKRVCLVFEKVCMVYVSLSK